MRARATLVTGAAGEIGHALIERLSAVGRSPLVTIDLQDLAPELAARTARHFRGSIVEPGLLDRILSEFEIDEVYHLAALLSTRSEIVPETAHQVNVEGTLRLLEFGQKQAQTHGHRVLFFFPSSIAAYGLPDLAAKARAGRVREDEWNLPRTMYGCNKLYCEHLGRYYASFYRQLDSSPPPPGIDFRSIRFPGLISADTVPSGGTSDYAPEMVHAAAQGKAYACFVRPETRIPFLAMPDAIDATLALASAPAGALTRMVYNIAAFHPSAAEIRDLVQAHFPDAAIAFEPHERRQRIVDSWPEDVDDAAARKDWGFLPRLDLESAFAAYLVPRIRARYARG